jgi:hypothetical protein
VGIKTNHRDSIPLVHQQKVCFDKNKKVQVGFYANKKACGEFIHPSSKSARLPASHGADNTFHKDLN